MKWTQRHCQMPVKILETAALATPGELPGEGRPEGLGLVGTNIAEHLAAAIGVAPDRNDNGDRDDTASLPHLHFGHVDP